MNCPEPSPSSRRVDIALETLLFVFAAVIAMSFTWFGTGELVDRHTLNLINQVLGPEYGCASGEARDTTSRAVRMAVAPRRAIHNGTRTERKCRFAEDPIDAHPPGQQLITVVTLTDSGLELAEEQWPASYLYHANVLEEIARLQPAGIFVDIHFAEAHVADDTVGVLVERIRAIERGDYLERGPGGVAANEKPPRVWLAGDPDECDGGVLSTLVDKSADRVVLAPRASDSEDRHDRAYPLALMDRPAKCRMETFAARAYRDFDARFGASEAGHARPVRPNDERFRDDLVVVWGNRSPPINGTTMGCRHDQPWWDLLIARIDGRPSDFKSPCPYHATVPASFILNRMHGSDLDPMIRGRYVLYGVDRLYSYDRIVPPTHVEIAAVYLHAMALDNLITFGEGYIRDEGNHRRIAFFMIGLMLVTFGIARSWIAGRMQALDPSERVPAVVHDLGACGYFRVVLSIGFGATLATFGVLMVVASVLFTHSLGKVWSSGFARGGCAVASLVLGVYLMRRIMKDDRELAYAHRALVWTFWVSLLLIVLVGIVFFFFYQFSVVPVDAISLVVAAVLSLSDIYTRFEVRVVAWIKRAFARSRIPVAKSGSDPTTESLTV